jgi:hypothetical protein
MWSMRSQEITFVMTKPRMRGACFDNSDDSPIPPAWFGYPRYARSALLRDA